jgi:xanthine dehydrogenase YagS FAD-binding subunit
MVTEVLIPQPPDTAKQVFLKFRLREAVDFSIVSVAALLTIENGICKDATIVLGGTAPCPFRAREAEEAIKGKTINAETAEAASKAAIMNALPLKKNAYEVEITKNLVKRALLS